jgi:CubicO group peptidase (beta-lactamase class C family)
VRAAPAEFLRFLDQAVAARGRAGVVGVAAIEEFEIAWTAVAGGAEDAVFQAGSLSKSVTSAVALELVRRGQLGLDADVGESLVSWRPPAGAGPVTLRRLLGHTAGANVPFYPGYPQGGPAPTPTQSLDGVEPAKTDAVVIDPRRAGGFRYSGGGFTIVQQLIEDITGTPFAEVAAQAVLEPLGMTRSTFAQPPPEPLRVSAANPDWRLYPECAAAGLWTTPADLARFVCALLAAASGDGGGLARETADAMTTPHARVAVRGQWMVLALLGLELPTGGGLGVFVRGPRCLNLGGAAKGFSALTEDGSGAIVMTAGFRPAFALGALFELGDAMGQTGLRASRRRVGRRASALLLRALS